jgi:hypothetical protein
VRALLLGGGVDPRLVSVLSSVVEHHSVVLGGFGSVVDPVHAQSVDIVSVDGEPVGPGNVAARDLITEVAALDPSLRPSEIGTPWPIEAQGFFTDVSHPDRLHLGFVSAGDFVPGGGVGGVGGAGVSGGVGVAGEGVAGEGVAGVASPRHTVQFLAAVQPAPGSPLYGHGSVGASPLEQQGVPAQQLAAHGQTPNASGYVSPLPQHARIGRTDMGVDVDLNPGDPIVAPGNSKVLGIMPNWYAGQPYVALQLLDGPMKGHNYYVAEQINPAVSVGQLVAQGQPIAHYASSGTGIEIGWAAPNWEQTLAQAQGNTGDPSHNDAPAGISFRNFLRTFGL